VDGWVSWARSDAPQADSIREDLARRKRLAPSDVGKVGHSPPCDDDSDGFDEATGRLGDCGLQTFAKFRHALLRLEPIPRRIYVTFRRAFDVRASSNPMIELGIKRLLELNPGWSLEFAGDDDIDRYLERWLDAKDWAVLRGAHPVERSDVWRLLKVYREGGLYTDLDRLHNRRLDDLIANETRFVLPLSDRGDQIGDFAQDLICSARHNPAIRGALAISLATRHANATLPGDDLPTDDRVTASGARSFTYGVAEHLFGVWLGYMPGKPISDRIVELLGSLHPLLVSRVEHLPFGPSVTLDGQLSAAEIDAEGYQQAKLSLYSRAGVAHWTDAFRDARDHSWGDAIRNKHAAAAAARNKLKHQLD
jgi:hypothetical protein